MHRCTVQHSCKYGKRTLHCMRWNVFIKYTLCCIDSKFIFNIETLFIVKYYTHVYFFTNFIKMKWIILWPTSIFNLFPRIRFDYVKFFQIHKKLCCSDSKKQINSLKNFSQLKVCFMSYNEKTGPNSKLIFNWGNFYGWGVRARLRRSAFFRYRNTENEFWQWYGYVDPMCIKPNCSWIKC